MSPSSPEVQPGALLDDKSVLPYLRARGIIDAGADAVAHTLGGGVSNIVLLVEAGGRRMVVKQALARLRVAREWLADPDRTVTEGRALRLAAELDPHWVPEVVDLDEDANVLVIAAAPSGVPDWKHELLGGSVDVSVAAEVGSFLGRLHSWTARRINELRDFDRWEAFEQLRIRPYFGSLVEDQPDLEPIVMPYVEAMAARRLSLVHGDASPKNVLVGQGVLWLIDFEVAHLGDPEFDVAFMLSHLLLKSIHLPSHEGVLLEAADAFTTAYDNAGALAPRSQHRFGLCGCLLLARVDGRSPAEYLTEAERQQVRRLGRSLAADPPDELDSTIERL